MKLKILYIHGYGSTGGSQTATELQKRVDAEVFAPQFSNDLTTVKQIERNIDEARSHVNTFCPDIVIGSSFGGFITSFLDGQKRIVINPCLRPSEQLHILSPTMSQEDLKLLQKLETSHVISGNTRNEMHGLFGLQDELFSYISLFKELYGDSNIYTMPCMHRMDIPNIQAHLIPLILKVKNENSLF